MTDQVSPRNAMTKADLINIVAKKLDITQVQSGIIVEAALKSVVNALQSGQEVEIRGFGSFRFRNRAPRKCSNPKTGEKVDVPPKKIPYFKMGKELKALLNGQAAAEEAVSVPDPVPPTESRARRDDPAAHAPGLFHPGRLSSGTPRLNLGVPTVRARCVIA